MGVKGLKCYFFSGQRKLKLCPDLSPLRVQFKMSEEHPRPFHECMQFPLGYLPPRRNSHSPKVLVGNFENNPEKVPEYLLVGVAKLIFIPKRYQEFVWRNHINDKLKIKISGDTNSSCHFLLHTPKRNRDNFTVILYYSTLSGTCTNQHILTPKRYDEHPRHIIGESPPRIYLLQQIFVLQIFSVTLRVKTMMRTASRSWPRPHEHRTLKDVGCLKRKM